MEYKDREAMNLNAVAETPQAGQKISKKKLVTLLRLSYDILDKKFLDLLEDVSSYEEFLKTRNVSGAT